MIISGKVQGVFYRASAKEIADSLGIKGWVKNIQGNNVEIEASGNEEQLQQFIYWCHQGPPGAKVKNIDIKELPFENFTGFKIIRW